MKIEKLPAVCKIQYGYPFDSALFSEKEGHPLIRIRDVVRGYTETYTTEKCSDEYLVNQGDILIGMDGMFNVAKWKGSPAFLNQRVCRLIPGDKIDSEYLYYFMPKALKRIEEATPFVTVKHLKAKQLNDINFPMLPLMEQKKIAQQLVKIDYLLECRKIQLQKLDELVKSRFIEMFGDLSVNDKAWQTLLFDEVFDIMSSKRVLKAEWKSSGIPFLRVRDLVQLSDTGKLNCEFYISEEFYSKLSDSDGVPHKDDILVSATSTLGKCHIVEQEEKFYFKDADVLRFRAKIPVNPIYFVELMKSLYVKEQIKKTLGITTVSHFTIKAAKRIFMRYPLFKLQNEFADFVKSTEKSKLAIRKSLDDLETLKKSLMQQYFG